MKREEESPQKILDKALSILQKESGMAKASFIIAMIGIGVWFLIIIIASAGLYYGVRFSIWGVAFKQIIGLFVPVAFAGNLVGAGLGFATIKKNISNKWMATTGFIVNIVEPVIILILIRS